MDAIAPVTVGVLALGLLSALAYATYAILRGSSQSRSTQQQKALQAFRHGQAEVLIPVGSGMAPEEVVRLGQQYGYAVTEWPTRYEWFYTLRPAAPQPTRSPNVPPPPQPPPPFGNTVHRADQPASPPPVSAPIPPSPAALERTRHEIFREQAGKNPWVRVIGFLIASALFGWFTLDRYLKTDDAFLALGLLTGILFLATILSIVTLVIARRQASSPRHQLPGERKHFE